MKKNRRKNKKRKTPETTTKNITTHKDLDKYNMQVNTYNDEDAGSEYE